MRVVVYDDEDMEPITVLNLRGVTERHLSERGFRWRVPVPEPLTFKAYGGDEAATAMTTMRVVDLEFEPLRRNTRDGRQQESWICFTKAAALAMLLTPGWLPGQLPAVRYLETQNDALTSMLMKVLSS